ncbi:uncharacterized protein BCR38DRAFT_221406 [Pseudomassariella vexata]|uniref:Uncharacterized protein n=1 Tax=Pseudomassariella vexata TaxID=1141098 RepID=A0A1Y2DV13_9PEZI|nr:uncharacterized protein BCR38DRAFT_221406 [Pseudomassariella vexata]ORY63098.1 hypothetical protein BCR38DRAFT_221406 [Pseudomassariella vexata]
MKTKSAMTPADKAIMATKTVPNDAAETLPDNAVETAAATVTGSKQATPSSSVLSPLPPSPLPLHETPWGCFPPAVPDSRILHTLISMRKSFMEDTLRNYSVLDGFQGELDEITSIERVGLENWLQLKQKERCELRARFSNDPDLVQTQKELQASEVLAWKAPTPIQRLNARQDIPRLKRKLAEQCEEFDKADEPIRAEITGVLVAAMGFKRCELNAYQKSKFISATAPATRTRELTSVEKMFGALNMDDDATRSPTPDNDHTGLSRPSSGHSVFRMTLDESTTAEARFDYHYRNSLNVIKRASKEHPENHSENHPQNHPEDHPKQQTEKSSTPYQIHIPDWFRVLEAQDCIMSTLPTVEERYKELTNQIYFLEDKIRANKYKEKAGPTKEWHNPSPDWHFEARHQKGGWWRCRSGSDATDAERKCKVCHYSSSPRKAEKENKDDPEAQLKYLMDLIDQASKEVAEKDKQEVIEQMKKKDQERLLPKVTTIVSIGKELAEEDARRQKADEARPARNIPGLDGCRLSAGLSRSVE